MNNVHPTLPYPLKIRSCLKTLQNWLNKNSIRRLGASLQPFLPGILGLKFKIFPPIRQYTSPMLSSQNVFPGEPINAPPTLDVNCSRRCVGRSSALAHPAS